MSKRLDLTFLAIAFLLFSCVQLMRPMPAKPPLRAEYAPAKGFEKFVLGYRDVVADIMWLNVIQNIEDCGSGKQNVSFFTGKSTPRCQYGWSYQMLDRITDAAPRYQVAYGAGATILSVLVDDRDGATALFEKGVQHFPEDWSLSYRAAYHALYEVGDQEKAAKLLVQAGQHGAPSWVFSLAAKLYTEEGQVFLARSVLQSALQNPSLQNYRERLEKRLNELENGPRRPSSQTK